MKKLIIFGVTFIQISMAAAAALASAPATIPPQGPDDFYLAVLARNNMNDTFIGLKKIGGDTVAEFEHEYPVIVYDVDGREVEEKQFLINLPSLLVRIENAKKYNHSYAEEKKALTALIRDMMIRNLQH